MSRKKDIIPRWETSNRVNVVSRMDPINVGIHQLEQLKSLSNKKLTPNVTSLALVCMSPVLIITVTI